MQSEKWDGKEAKYVRQVVGDQLTAVIINSVLILFLSSLFVTLYYASSPFKHIADVHIGRRRLRAQIRPRLSTEREPSQPGVSDVDSAE